MGSLKPVQARRDHERGSPSGAGHGRIWAFRLVLSLAVLLNALALSLVVQRPLGPLSSLPTSPGPAPVPTGAGAAPPIEPTATPIPASPAAPTAVAAAPMPAPPTAAAHVQNPGGKIRGVNIPVWGPDYMIAAPAIQAVPVLGGNWVSLVTHWYVDRATGGPIFREDTLRGKGQQRTVSDASLGAAIDQAHALGLKVLLKPHVDWIEGGWRGWFYFADVQSRADWWSTYRAMITATTRLALDHGAEGICIGTEFAEINKEAASAAEWTAIITQIRGAGYHGQLTYAANWGYGTDAEYNRPGLAGVWEQLDFIGVDAYFPLSTERSPSEVMLAAGWRDAVNPWDTRSRPMHQDHLAELQNLHERTNKPVVFTEIGYPATDYAAKNPAADESAVENPALQDRAAQAAYLVWEDIPWWGGALWWQFGPVYNNHSLQGRPILVTLRRLWMVP